MDTKTAARMFPEISLRIKKMFFIPSVYMDFKASDCFEEFVETMIQDFDEGLEEFKSIFGEIPDWFADEWQSQDKEMVFDYLSEEKQGFVAEFATPVRIFYTSDSGEHAEYSWGRYRTQWIYGETIEELFEAGMKWFNNVIEEQRTRYQEKEGV
ncbi:hypothetical protein [Desulforegula conservatrix]|uniref:hypothetical protein n=1 Tax=Desulforegula conservatrix TaxID=153026 RepID=UPI0003FE18AE|nr:hypothetical protein [Desulforegula conservatrix]